MLNKLFMKGELRILWPVYLMYFFLGFSNMLDPYLIIYFRELGFSFVTIALLTAAFSLGTLLFEVPTGIFADGKSRKWSVLIGFVIVGSGIFFMPFINSFIGMFLLWFIAGVGMAFISGADEAWIVDNLKVLKRNDLRKEVFMKIQVLAGVGLIIGPLFSSLIVKYFSLQGLWMAAGLCIYAGGLVIFFYDEHYIPRRTNVSIKNYFKKTKYTFKYIFSKRPLVIMIIGAIFMLMITMSFNGWQPLLIDLGMPEHGLGILYSIMGALFIVSAFIPRLIKNYKIRHIMPIIISLMIISLLTLFFIYPPMFMIASIIFLLNHAVLGASYAPILYNYFHKHIPSSIRATAVSARSMILSATGIITTIVGGLIIDSIGPRDAIAWTSIFGIFAIMMYMQLKD